MKAAAKWNRIFHYCGNPGRLLHLVKFLRPAGAFLSLPLLGAGLPCALFFSPADWQQGETARIMYLHVPLAWLASLCYLLLCLSSACFLIWRNPLAALASQALAPLGATCAALCLLTGMLWGRLAWGAWWVWDARLTSVLLLLLLYLGCIAVPGSFENIGQGRKIAAVLTLIGGLDLPVIKFSVLWWNTLHQPPSIRLAGAPAMPAAMLLPLFLCTAGLASGLFWLWMTRLETLIRQSRLRRLIRHDAGLP